MKEVPIFIASSIVEFETERLQIAQFLERLNNSHESDGVRLKWYRPETMPRALYAGGSQSRFDEKIRESQFFALIIGTKLGAATEHEFDVALEQFRKTGAPLIIPYFIDERASVEVMNFERRVRKELSIGEQYTFLYKTLDAIMLQFLLDLQDYGAFKGDAEPSDVETAARNGLDGIRGLIEERKRKIATLNAQPVSWENVQDIATLYGEIWRLVQEYKVEPAALTDYMEFLWKQHLYDTAIEVGKWLETFYQLENADETTLARLKDNLGLFYDKSNRHTQAEQYYRETLEIWRRLAKGNPAAFAPDLALTCNNLAFLLYNTNRMEEAEELYGEALEIQRCLAKGESSAFEPDLARTCDNLALLLSDTNRMEEAEELYGEALEIRRRLAKGNPAAFEPDLAQTCDNLANLFSDTNRMEEAEELYGEALEIYRRLAEGNPAAFEPDLATTCNNLANFLYKTNRMEEAESRYREALEIWRRLAKENPAAFEPYLAGTCNDLAIFLGDTNRKEEAKERYGEALEIRRRLAKGKPAAFEPDLASTCNNLGYLFIVANKMEVPVSAEQIAKAEPYFQKALKIWRRFAEENPKAHEPDVAVPLYNLGVLEYKRGNPDAARPYFEESLSLFEKFPHCAERAQQVRDALAFLDAQQSP